MTYRFFPVLALASIAVLMTACGAPRDQVQHHRLTVNAPDNVERVIQVTVERDQTKEVRSGVKTPFTYDAECARFSAEVVCEQPNAVLSVATDIFNPEAPDLFPVRIEKTEQGANGVRFEIVQNAPGRNWSMQINAFPRPAPAPAPAPATTSVAPAPSAVQEPVAKP